MLPEQLRDSAELLRVSATTARPIGVDREANILRGYVVAQLGPFKDIGRGEFDQRGLDMLLQLGKDSKQGVKSRFSHPTECDDGLGKYLGRSRDWYMSEAVNADGVKVPAIRGNLHFDKTALDTPPAGGKPLGLYVMDLAESDPDAISSSVGIRTKKEIRLKPDGTRLTGPNGEELPPLWFPVKLFASDVVDTGAAVDGLLSAEGVTDGLPNAILWQASEMLNEHFEGLSRAEVKERIDAFAAKYLAMRFGPESISFPAAPVTEVVKVEYAPPVQPDPAQPLQPSLSVLLLRQRQREVESLT